MEFKIIQNYRGQFYIGDNTETHCFKMAIVDENKEIIKNEKGIKALLEYNGEESHDYFDDPVDCLEQVFDICVADREKVISSTPHREQAVFFAKVFNENRELINSNEVEKMKVRAEKEIKELESKIEHLKKKLTYKEVLNIEVIESVEFENINKRYNKWIIESSKKLNDLIPGSESYIAEQKNIEKYRDSLITV